MIVGLIQQRSTTDLEHNLRRGQELAHQALEQGATWLLFPENAPFLGRDRDKLSVAQPLDGPIVEHYRALARDAGCWVTVGSVPERSPSPDHTYNTQIVLDPSGQLVAAYRKIHLFDVELDDGTHLHESATILPGDALVTHTIPWTHAPLAHAPLAPSAEPAPAAIVGMSVCYDLRFAELYRALTLDHGAHILTVPSAFTLQTGRFHWHALLRARAIENQTYVLAPNQYGVHGPGRASFGQSAIYDPWGQLLAQAPERECVVCAPIELEPLLQVRRRMPCHAHARQRSPQAPRSTP